MSINFGEQLKAEFDLNLCELSSLVARVKANMPGKSKRKNPIAKSANTSANATSPGACFAAMQRVPVPSNTNDFNAVTVNNGAFVEVPGTVSHTVTSVNMHDYLGLQMESMLNGAPEQSEFPPSLPLSPALSSAAASSPAASSSAAISPVAKQGRFAGPVAQDSMTTMLSEFHSLRQLLNERSDAMEILVNQNSLAIAELKAEVKENTSQVNGVRMSLDHLCAEIVSLKERVDVLETHSNASKKTTAALGNSISLLESYSRRWNLILHGLEEKDRQDIRQEAIQILQRVLPEVKDKLPDVVDTVHRLGTRRLNVTRSVIIQFSLRLYRDAIWRAAKQSVYLSANNLRLAEDLSQADRERRRQLWPLVDKARKENKLAYFKGGRAFVDGSEIFPP